MNTHQFQYRDLHHTLIEVCRFVFHHLDGHDLVRLHVLTFNDLAKRSLPQDIQDEVSTEKKLTLARGNHKLCVLVSVLSAQPVVDVKDVVVVLIVITVVVGRLARLC